ncbi:B-cell scaffold protein with ankyrin repeats-like isoform X1 [Alosa pseudoharengus]|uniref:B-cell scaffold protein with ankyrin repeats-like isoform X1 n=1 Tax=Alosa pseudoharengus TaxID=34774 RepID=UPI003F8CB096
MSGTAADLLIIYEAEAEQWASYMRSVLVGPVADEGICCYDIAAVTGRKSQEDFLCLVQYRCKLLILSRGLLEALCPLRRFFLARVLTPPSQVVVLLCGVPSLAPLLEQVPLQGDVYLQISSEQEAHEYTATVADIVRKGGQVTSMEPVSRRASGPDARLEKLSAGGAVAAKAPLLLVPSRVPCEAPGEVYLLLQESVPCREAEVEFTAGKHKVRVKTTSWNDNTLSVNPPEFPAGSVGVTLYCGGVAKGKAHLQYYSSLGEMANLLTRAADPVDFMCQAFQVCSVEQLDETLAGCLIQKLPTRGLRELQWDQHPEAGASGSTREDIPTLLHFVAQHGLRDLGSVLLQCPGAQRALHTPNRHGQTPLDLAQANGHTQLHILLQGALNVQSGEEGEDSSVYEMMSTAGKPKSSPPDDAHQAGKDEDQEEEEEEDPYAPLGVNNEEYDTILSPSNSVVIANRPPAPTPRPETIPTKEDRTPYIAQVFQKKMSQPDAGTLYSLPLKQVRERESISSTYDTFVASHRPPGLDELISLQQQVKLGTLSVDDALDRFSQWQRLQKGVDSVQQEKLRQMRASLINYREDDDSVYDKINIIHHTPNVAVKDCRRGSQPAESDFYSKPLKGQPSNLFWKADKR